MAGRDYHSWTPEEIAKLEVLAKEGLTRRQMTEVLNENRGPHEWFTRDQVIATCLRNGIGSKNRPPANIKNAKSRRPGISTAREKGLPPERKRVEELHPKQGLSPDSEPVLPARSRGSDSAKKRKVKSCLWPIGDPKDRDFHFCGDTKVVDGKPYCEAHYAKAHTKSLRVVRSRWRAT